MRVTKQRGAILSYQKPRDTVVLIVGPRAVSQYPDRITVTDSARGVQWTWKGTPAVRPLKPADKAYARRRAERCGVAS